MIAGPARSAALLLFVSLFTVGQATVPSTIAFVSTRHDTTLTAADGVRAFNAAEIYLMDGGGTHARRITENAGNDGFPALTPVLEVAHWKPAERLARFFCWGSPLGGRLWIHCSLCSGRSPSARAAP